MAVHWLAVFVLQTSGGVGRLAGAVCALSPSSLIDCLNQGYPHKVPRMRSVCWFLFILKMQFSEFSVHAAVNGSLVFHRHIPDYTDL